MTEHLPECILPTYLDAVLWRRAPQGLRVPCICDELRACEDRVLNAAREAVELKTWISVYELSDESKAYNKGIRATLAAIDALKEKP